MCTESICVVCEKYRDDSATNWTDFGRVCVYISALHSEITWISIALIKNRVKEKRRVTDKLRVSAEALQQGRLRPLDEEVLWGRGGWLREVYTIRPVWTEGVQSPQGGWRAPVVVRVHPAWKGPLVFVKFVCTSRTGWNSRKARATSCSTRSEKCLCSARVTMSSEYSINLYRG